jgi:UDP:flavonoid glycosyltransferase YjiC (YdhE family)
LLALVDVVLTKPGYGTFVEAACHGVPLLYVPRDDWPEEEHLVAWMHQNARCAAVERSALFVGDIGECVDRLLGSAPPSCLPLPSGISDAVDVISGFFPG